MIFNLFQKVGNQPSFFSCIIFPMKKKLLTLTTLFATASVALCSCDVSTFLEILGSITTTASYDDARADVSADLSYIPEGPGFKASQSKYVYEDILDSNGNYPCGSSGNMRILVIPVAIKGHENVATQTNLNRIQKAFFGEAGETGWQSVASFYKKSSYGALNFSGVVADEWYNPGWTTNDLINMKPKAGTHNSGHYEATWDVLEGAVSWYKSKYNDDCTQFDNDKDGMIDGVWLVYGCHSAQEDASLPKKLFWAYNYKDYSVTTPNKLNPVAYSYCWASYDFMNTGYGEESVDAHTYIHETGHLIGLEDYYVASAAPGEQNFGPMGALDMMDYNIIDHNAYSKFALGWTKPYVIEDSTEIVLNPSATTGQAILLPTSAGWNGSAFDEYILMEYYTPDNLNYQDSFHGYSYYPKGFTQNGVRIYHVDARMAVIKNGSQYANYASEFNAAARDQAIIPQSNSSAYSANNASKYFVKSPDPNFTRFRLIQELDCGMKRNFDTSNQTRNGEIIGVFADNSTLFGSGSKFSFEEYKDSFPNFVYANKKLMNNGNELPWSVEFSNATDTSITVKITKL